jgi:hypothetical protein
MGRRSWAQVRGMPAQVNRPLTRFLRGFRAIEQMSALAIEITQKIGLEAVSKSAK